MRTLYILFSIGICCLIERIYLTNYKNQKHFTKCNLNEITVQVEPPSVAALTLTHLSQFEEIHLQLHLSSRENFFCVLGVEVVDSKLYFNVTCQNYYYSFLTRSQLTSLEYVSTVTGLNNLANIKVDTAVLKR
jgi:hypothetical protein